MKLKSARPDLSKIKYLDFEFAGTPVMTKDASGALMIEGYANTVDKDRVQEVVLPTAFESSLQGFMENPVMLFQHDWDKIIGHFTEAKITDKGLWVKGKVSGAKDCEDVKTKIAEGSLRTFSIGYNEVDSYYDEAKKVKIIKDLELLEVSVVTIPANPQAKFTPVTEQPTAEPAEGGTLEGGDNGELKALISALEALAERRDLLPQLKEYLNNIDQKGSLMKTPASKTAATAPATQPAAAAAPAATGTKAEPMAAPAAGAAAEGGAAPAAAEGGEAKPDMGKVMEALSAIAETLKQIQTAIAPAKEGEEGDGKEGGESKPGEGEGKEPASAASAPAASASEEKPVDEMKEEEVDAELEKAQAELEQLTGAQVSE